MFDGTNKGLESSFQKIQIVLLFWTRVTVMYWLELCSSLHADKKVCVYSFSLARWRYLLGCTWFVVCVCLGFGGFFSELLGDILKISPVKHENCKIPPCKKWKPWFWYTHRTPSERALRGKKNIIRFKFKLRALKTLELTSFSASVNKKPLLVSSKWYQ